jgi:hypothetical protein
MIIATGPLAVGTPLDVGLILSCDNKLARWSK